MNGIRRHAVPQYIILCTKEHGIVVIMFINRAVPDDACGGTGKAPKCNAYPTTRNPTNYKVYDAVPEYVRRDFMEAIKVCTYDLEYDRLLILS